MTTRTISKVINRGAYSYLILHDPCHGPKSNRYTVYKIDRLPGIKKEGRTRIIGRELPWQSAHDIVEQQEVEKLLW